MSFAVFVAVFYFLAGGIFKLLVFFCLVWVNGKVPWKLGLCGRTQTCEVKVFFERERQLHRRSLSVCLLNVEFVDVEVYWDVFLAMKLVQPCCGIHFVKGAKVAWDVLDIDGSIWQKASLDVELLGVDVTKRCKSDDVLVPFYQSWVTKTPLLDTVLVAGWHMTDNPNCDAIVLSSLQLVLHPLQLLTDIVLFTHQGHVVNVAGLSIHRDHS